MSSCNWKHKLNEYNGNVVATAVYASQAWLPSNGNLSEIENAQCTASKWILSWKLDYQKRTVPLHILTLVLYVQIMFC